MIADKNAIDIVSPKREDQVHVHVRLIENKTIADLALDDTCTTIDTQGLIGFRCESFCNRVNGLLM